MFSNQSATLVSLHEVDKEIIARETTAKSLELEVQKLEKRLSSTKTKLQTLELQLEKAKKTHSDEEVRHKEEEKKIVERRKQISALGGAKSAKLAERELDIAKRQMETLEQIVLDAMLKLDNLGKERDHLIELLVSIEKELEEKGVSAKVKISDLNKELTTLKSSKDKKVSSIDPRVITLYKRVESRYRGDAVAVAENGSCRSCFRALPAQTFNQVMAGYNLIQCPGCSRILVYIDPATVAS